MMLRGAHGLDHKQYEEFLRDRLAGVGWTTPDALFADLGGQPEEFEAHWAGRIKWDLRVHGYREVEEDLPEWETRAPRTFWVRRLDRAEDEPWLESDPEEDALCELIGYWGQPPFNTRN